MDNFYIGQKFEGEYPPEAAIWCNNNGAMISQVESWLEIQSIPSPTLEERLFAALRASRDARLAATDKYLLADYPIGEGDLALVKTYRAALRALPEQPGAPWDGGGELTPWPTKPEI